MTITTEDAEALAVAIESASILRRADAANALRTLAAERDIANEQIYGLAEERERWKERAQRAEAEAERLREALIETTDICDQCLFEYILIKGRYVYRKEAVARARAALEGGENKKPRQP